MMKNQHIYRTGKTFFFKKRIIDSSYIYIVCVNYNIFWRACMQINICKCIYACRSNASDLVREDAASGRELAGADPGGAAVAIGAFRPVRGAPADPPVRGPRPQQPPRRRVGAPPQDPHARLQRRKPQAARALRRRHGAADAGGARAATVVVGGGRVRRGGGGRG